MPFVTEPDYITAAAPLPRVVKGLVVKGLAVKGLAAKDTDAAMSAALAAQLRAEPAAHRRVLLFSALATRRSAPAARAAARFLRSPDPALRNGAIEALQSMGDCAMPMVDRLFANAPPAVRLLAIEITRVWPENAAQARLARILQTDPHINVCAAAADVAAQTGAPALLAPLAGLPARFPGQAFIGFAADIAITRIRAGGAKAA